MQESYQYDCTKTLPNNPEKSKLDLCIDSIIRREGYIYCDVIKQKISSDGGSYLGNLFEINIKGKTADGEKETPIFVKAMAPDAIDNEFLSLENIYNKELFAYTELSKVFSELQDEVDVPKNERFKTAKCFKESYHKAIILENLTSKGFRTWFRMDCVTLDMAAACITELAKFHALSFVIQAKRPDYFEDKIKALDQPFIFNSKAYKGFCSRFMKITLEYLDGDTRRKVEDKVHNVMQKYSQYLQDETSKRCLCHGDYRTNNIMIKEEGVKIIEVIPVDYQIIHYGCPILDFHYFMYNGSDVEFRQNHMSYFKNLYYESLEKFLQYFDVSAESVYSRKLFEKEFEEKRDYGLMVSVLYAPFIFVSEGEAPDIMSKDSLSDMDISLDERFRDRFSGTVQEFIELGFL